MGYVVLIWDGRGKGEGCSDIIFIYNCIVLMTVQCELAFKTGFAIQSLLNSKMHGVILEMYG